MFHWVSDRNKIYPKSDFRLRNWPRTDVDDKKRLDRIKLKVSLLIYEMT